MSSSRSVWTRPKGVAQPIPFLALAQEHFPAHQRHHEQPQADGIEADRVPAILGAGRPHVLGVLHGEITERERQRPHRQVDVEDPAPGIFIGDVAAERRAEDGAR